MDAQDIEELVQYELAMQLPLFTAKGIDIDEFSPYLLHPPVQESFRISEREGDRLLWIVLDEFPDDPSRGMLIVYDEEEGAFALACKPAPDQPAQRVQLCGRFMDALEAI